MLTDGRYTWRHDKVLAVFADSLDKARRKKRKPVAGPHLLNFVKAGQQGPRAEEAGGILETASDWQMRVDLRTRTTFPTEIVVTNQRPDIVIWSSATKQVVMLELTVVLYHGRND